MFFLLQTFDWDFTYWKDLAISIVMTFINAIFDINDNSSLIMIFYNLLPIVGNNSLPLETWVLIAAASGIFVAHYRGWV